MKKILSILLAITCILCVTACGSKPSDATSFEEVAAILESEAETYRLCDEEEIDQYEEFFTGSYTSFEDTIKAMCYAKMPDGTHIRVFKMNYDGNAEKFKTTYGANYEYVHCVKDVVMFGTSPFIEEFK